MLPKTADHYEADRLSWSGSVRLLILDALHGAPHHVYCHGQVKRQRPHGQNHQSQNNLQFFRVVRTAQSVDSLGWATFNFLVRFLGAAQVSLERTLKMLVLPFQHT